MENYEINKDTVALIPISEIKTKIIEINRKIIVNKPIMKIIEYSCNYFGSSYLGRHEGTKKLIGVTHKAPIIIEESLYLIYFPTMSPRLKNCCWLSLKFIKQYKRHDNKTLITFENGQQLLINISIGSFDNQYLRAIKLESVLRKRMLKKI